MNPLFRIILKLLSSPKINMQEDYVLVRKVQQLFSSKPKKGYRVLDKKIYSKDRSHDIPVRIFYPKEPLNEDVLVFFHGGGWVIGDIDTYTPACINMADLTGRVVYSVDYRLAPEHPYPSGLEDCYRVAETLMTHLELAGLMEASQITLIGDSAGGNLVAAVSLMLRDRGKTVPAKQVLLYPVTYWDHTENSPFESIRTNGYEYGLTAKKVQEYMEMYEPDLTNRKNPYISPLMAEDLTQQPKTLVITAEFDPLRDEGEMYGIALKEAGNDVVIQRIGGTVHGFINYPKIVVPVTAAYQAINNFLNA
ncbi:alpha/beta hydrolase [Carnobacterium pleistocenium]|uniref:alpha/beta hydrolase n=1 Tax=Carnobacterium pleistocenium TaxID=181073 RepID=UPI0005510A90|nr:alpha/beta hydrolase [Carnobacterium pleistocenium]